MNELWSLFLSSCLYHSMAFMLTLQEEPSLGRCLELWFPTFRIWTKFTSIYKLPYLVIWFCSIIMDEDTTG